LNFQTEPEARTFKIQTPQSEDENILVHFQKVTLTARFLLLAPLFYYRAGALVRFMVNIVPLHGHDLSHGPVIQDSDLFGYIT